MILETDTRLFGGSCVYTLVLSLHHERLRIGHIIHYLISQLRRNSAFGARVGSSVTTQKPWHVLSWFLRVAILTFGIAESILIIRVCALCMVWFVLEVGFGLNKYSHRWSTKGIMVPGWYQHERSLSSIDSLGKLFARFLTGIFARKSGIRYFCLLWLQDGQSKWYPR